MDRLIVSYCEGSYIAVETRVIFVEIASEVESLSEVARSGHESNASRTASDNWIFRVLRKMRREAARFMPQKAHDGIS